MNQNVFYCKEWSIGYKEPIDLYSENKARKKHEFGELYTVLIGSDVEPSCFINITKNAGWVSVGFLDQELREYLFYSFKVINDNKLFLSMAVHREFAKNEGEGAGILNVSSGTTYIFNEDGNTIVREEQFNPYKLEESQTMVDISGNYEKFPEFGKYDLLIRKER
ncbi:lytic transglycosylase [Proteus hauseri]|uniref:lytic transglycosylase n=1 Tax=Proteus cibi TaxID=2050966 RepID=UPI000D68AC72|nr:MULTISPECIES: lytic transglycosylase [Proteus]MBG6032870.1 lytic transglycosylase [Proteus hauseri]